MSTYVQRWWVIALIGMASSMSCGDTAPVEVHVARDATKTAQPSSTGKATMTPDLRAAYVAAVQSDASATYRAEREVSGAARFVHPMQGFDATIDGAQMRLGPEQAGTWEMSLSTMGVGCDGDPGLGLSAGAVEIEGNRAEIMRPELREWYVNGPLGLEQGFTLEHASSCAGTKVVTIDVGGSVVPELEDADGNGRGEAITFVDAEGMRLARYTDLYATDATGKRLDAWMSVTAGRIALHVDDVGATYPVQIDPLIWVEQVKLLTSDGASNDSFGNSVALSGETALVGARNDDVYQGSAYVFTRNGVLWTEQAKLTASDGAPNHSFGNSVALSGDTALVGACDDDIGTNDAQGSAYVFTRTGVLWTEQAKLTASDGLWNDLFGISVALSGDTALVGAFNDNIGANAGQGSAYVFTRSGVLWTQQAKLTASDGDEFDYFGDSVALSGDTALVGAFNDTIGMYTGQGSAYVFTRAGVLWTEQAKLTASDGMWNDLFGGSVALSGDTALVGASCDNIGANTTQGSAYVFTRSNDVWTLQQKLTASDGILGSSFGISVALSGDMALVGAFSDDVGANAQQGSAYLFTRSETWWTQRAKLTASDGAASDYFGNSVALSGDTALVGAYFDDIGANAQQGSAYVFLLTKLANGTGCGTDLECLSGFCVDGVCCNVACGGDCQACSTAAGAVMNGTCAPTAMGTECRAPAGACDAAESCDGVSDVCPTDARVAAGTECRASVGACDAAESCDGALADCPTDALVAAGIECRASVGACDVAERCYGTVADCPADTLLAAGTECRASSGTCDVAEHCDGTVADCPADALAAAGTECRSATGTCDKVENCDGALPECPANVDTPDGTICAHGTCSSGVCNLVPEPGACDCQAVGTSPGGTSSAALSLLGLAFLVKRRRQHAHRM